MVNYKLKDWAEKELSQRVLLPLPLLIELRIYARDKDEKKCKNILEFFHQGNLICHLNQLALDDKLEKGQALVLFDGLDEVFNPQLRQEIVTDIKRFSIQYPQVQIIVTSRWLGYKAEELNHAGFEHFMIQDLDKDQIEDFIQRWHDLAFENRDDKTQKQERLQKAIKESKAIRELAVNPLLLTMMAILNRTQELPRDRSKLYEKASEVLLHQWDFETKEGLIDPELKKYLYNIDLRDKRDILRLVASAMQAGEKGLAANLIYKEELENVLNKNQDKTILVALHHPLMSNGTHGGQFSMEKQVFPFESKFPLPVLGSFINLLRKTSGASPQDLQNKVYQSYIKRMTTLLQGHDNTVLVSGHDHNLQYIEKNNLVQIISGSGSKTEAARAVGKNDFSFGGNGYAVVKTDAKNQVHVTFYAIENDTEKVLWQKTIWVRAVALNRWALRSAWILKESVLKI